VSKIYILSEYIILTMPENKKRVNAFIPLELYSQIIQSDESYTDCITKALNLYFNGPKPELQESKIKDLENQNETLIRELEDFKKRGSEDKNILQEKESEIKDLENQNENLKRKLEDSKKKEPENKDLLQEKELRIKELESHKETLKRELEDLKNKEPENKDLLQEKELRIQELKEQIKSNDSKYEKITNDLQNQLKVKDDQIEKRDSDIKNLVAITTSQTYKAIEAPGAKKKWWRFW